MDCLKNGKPDQKYSENVRQFCIALNYYSPAAYRYVRSVFADNLPHPRTMRLWLHSVDGSPGITNESLVTLENKFKENDENGGREHLVALIKDEMYIKKKIEYNAENHKFGGFVTVRDQERNELDEQLAVANKALVYMVVGKNFKIPVAYYLLSGLNSYGTAALTQTVIESINNTGVKVISLTQDGPRENFKMVEHLGADLKNDKPYFKSPTNPSDKIYVIFDAPHMVKLFRACLKYHKLYHDGKPLHWSFIESLYEMQQKRNFNLGNKLTDMHLNFHNKPMDVRIACETLSLSSANGIDICRNDGYENFNDSEKTTEYIRYVNNCFDVLNFKPGINGAGKNFKRPLNSDTANEFFEYFAKAREFFQCMEIDEVVRRKVKGKKEKENCIVRKPAIQSRNRTPFLGFIHNLTALEGLYADHVLNGSLPELNSFQFSQDHLETFFSSVRSGLGENCIII